LLCECGNIVGWNYLFYSRHGVGLRHRGNPKGLLAIGRDDFHHGYFGANVWQLGTCPRILLFYGEALRPKPEKAGVGTARCRQMDRRIALSGFNTTPGVVR